MSAALVANYQAVPGGLRPIIPAIMDAAEKLVVEPCCQNSFQSESNGGLLKTAVSRSLAGKALIEHNVRSASLVA